MPALPELSWIDWDAADHPLIEFTAQVARLRHEHPTFRRKRFFTGSTVRTGDGERLNDIVWLTPEGHPMESDDWQAPADKTIGMYLNGHGIAGRGMRGERIEDDHFLLYANASEQDVEITLPAEEYSALWAVAIDTGGEVGAQTLAPGSAITIMARSLVLLQEAAPVESEDSSVAASVASLGASVPAPEPATTTGAIPIGQSPRSVPEAPTPADDDETRADAVATAEDIEPAPGSTNDDEAR